MERKKATSENIKSWRSPNAVNGLPLCVPCTGSWYTLSHMIFYDSFLNTNLSKDSCDCAISDVIICIHPKDYIMTEVPEVAKGIAQISNE